MLEFDIRIVREAWTSHKPAMPEPFTLVGYESPYVFAVDGRPPLIIDAEGIILISGAVYTWCRSGCCTQNPRKWPSIEAAANFHGSYIVRHDGNVTAPDASD